MNAIRNTTTALVIALFMAMSLNGAADESAATVSPVDINTATQAELETLPGIGPSKAEAIVSHRARRPFKKVEDIMRVKGIGRKTFKKLSPYLKVSPPQKPGK